MQADLPLSEREQIGPEDQRALRAALVRPHVDVLDQQHAVEAVHFAIDIRGPEPRRVCRRRWVVSHAAISMLSAAA